MRRAELTVAVWSAVTFGALLASYMAFRPVRDALILEDADKLPWLFTGTLIAVSVLSPIWSAILARVRPRRAVPVSFHVFAACILVFAILVGNDVAPIAVSRTFYIWSAVFNLFVVSVFWSLLADLLGPEIAKRLYGPIAAGRSWRPRLPFRQGCQRRCVRRHRRQSVQRLRTHGRDLENIRCDHARAGHPARLLGNRPRH